VCLCRKMAPRDKFLSSAVGELTITLDDVSNLLHLPIIGQFYTYPSLDVAATTDLLHLVGLHHLCI